MPKPTQTNTKLVKGMFQDVHPLNQPPGTYRYALNIQFESDEGDMYSFSNESGNEICFSLANEQYIVGHTFVGNNDVVIFSINEATGKSEIGIVTEGCQYTTLVLSTCLALTRLHAVTGIFRIKNGCDRVIYFTDNFNAFRSINLDNLEQYTNLDGSDNHYSPAYANTNDEWNCTLMKHNPNFFVPEVSLDTVQNGGGSLLRGTYFFTIRYYDTEFNPTNWVYMSQAVPIVGGSFSNYDGVDGGNIDLTGNVLFKENKSILLNISNLDLNFPYYQLGVIEVTNGVQDEGDAFTLEIREINSSTSTYLYTGASTSKTPSTIDELVINSVIFNKVKTVAQIDNRLVLGNTQEDNRDWAVFQRETSKVLVNSTNEIFDKSLINESSKSGAYYFHNRSYMKDEVYALGIVYVFKDGTESPAFHIPGRAKDTAATTTLTYSNQDLVTQGNLNTHNRNVVPSTLDGEPTTEGWDSQLLLVSATNPVADPKREVYEDEVAHIPISEFTTPTGPKAGNTIERWKVVNTGIQFGSEISLHVNSYFECDDMYSDIQDCTGTSIWGTDYWGNTLEGTPIRHHKLFDETLVPCHDGAEARPTGKLDVDKQSVVGSIYTTKFLVSNINYPTAYASDIQGYYVVRVERTSETETVADKGIVGEIGIQTPGYYYTAGACGSIGNGGLPFFQLPVFPGPFLSADDAKLFISPKTQFEQSLKQVDYFKFENYRRGYGDPSLEYYLEESSIIPATSGASRDLNRQSNGFFYIEPETYQPASGAFTNIIENATFNMSFYVWGLTATFPSGTGVAPEHIYMSAKYWRKPYSNLFSLTYTNTGPMQTATGATIVEVTGGDTFISELTFGHINNGSGVLAVQLNHYTESSINSELRGHGTEAYETHIRYYPGWVETFLNLDEFPDDPAADYAFNYFRYDKHYSQESNFRTFFPLPLQWDYCTECPNSFPYRVWYSERAYQEELSDNYKNILANNYQDLLGSGGEITSLFVLRDQLYCLSENAAWFIPSRPQQLTTNENNVFIGTGDIFSVPPRRLETVERGYGGTLDPFTVNVSEFGAFWVDQNNGKVFLLAGQQGGLKDISMSGMRNWFNGNAELEIPLQIEGFSNFSTLHPQGAGFISTYDPRHNRIILTKKDYRIIDPTILAVLVIDETYVFGTTYGYNTVTGEFYEWTVGPSETILDWQSNTAIIEDLSWTISFDFRMQAWDSFHSYRPAWMWHNQNTFFSTPTNGEDGWKHDSLTFGDYYEDNHKSVMEFIVNKDPGLTKVLDSLIIYSKCENFNGNDYININYGSFDQIFIYTQRQSSGLLSLVAKNTIATAFGPSVDPQNNVAFRDWNEGRWTVNNFQNFLVNEAEPILTRDWSKTAYATARSYDGEIYYPNADAYSFTKDIFTTGPLRDQWFGIRLVYLNSQNYKLVTDFLATSQGVSFK